jgi:putative ABC transport system permease protein
MMGPWWLAWRYVLYHRVRGLTLIACVSLVALLPVIVSLLTNSFQAELVSRAQSTPLLVGPKGSRYDLVLQSLYFEGKGLDTIPASQVDRILDTGHAAAIPLLIKHRAKGFPVVGTTLDYLTHRSLRIQSGHTLGRLGDCVAGAHVARRLGLSPGEFLLTDSPNVFDIAGQTPLRMRVTGILHPSNSPDDDALFVDLKTAWIIEGIGHGHDDVSRVDPSLLLKKDENQITASAGVVSYTQITQENVDSFHFHGDPASFPITGIMVVPHDEKATSLLMGEYVDPKEPMQIVRPMEVMEELLRFVFRAKRFFDVQSTLVGLATLILLGLIMALSARLRQREMETLFKMGANRLTTTMMIGAEWIYIALASLVNVVVIATLAINWASSLLRYLLFA